MKALFYTAVVNGVLAPFLLIGVLLIATDRKIMHGQPSSLLNVAIVGITTLLMFAAALGMCMF